MLTIFFNGIKTMKIPLKRGKLVPDYLKDNEEACSEESFSPERIIRYMHSLFQREAKQFNGKIPTAKRSRKKKRRKLRWFSNTTKFISVIKFANISRVWCHRKVWKRIHVQFVKHCVNSQMLSSNKPLKIYIKSALSAEAEHLYSTVSTNTWAKIS